MDLVVSGILNFLTEQEAIGKADEVQDFYRYGIEITISSMLNIVLVLLMGALTGHLLESVIYLAVFIAVRVITCLLYTSPSPRDRSVSRMPSSA